MTPAPRGSDEFRKVRLAFDVFDGLRTSDGRRLSTEWGEPDAEGFYSPTLISKADPDTVSVSRKEWEALRDLRYAAAEVMVSFEDGTIDPEDLGNLGVAVDALAALSEPEP